MARGGYVHLWRRIMSSTAWTLTPPEFKALATMLIMANWKPAAWTCPRCHEVVMVPRGGFAFSVRSIADKAGPGVDRSVVSRTIARLLADGMLRRDSTRDRCHVCYVFVSYDEYNGRLEGTRQHPGTIEEGQKNNRRKKEEGTAPGAAPLDSLREPAAPLSEAREHAKTKRAQAACERESRAADWAGRNEEFCEQEEPGGLRSNPSNARQ